VCLPGDELAQLQAFHGSYTNVYILGNAAWDQTLSFCLTHHGTLVSLLNGIWILVVCMNIVYGVWIWGGLLNFDSYRLKQTLKEQSWWSNQYLLLSPHLRSKATSIEAKALLTFSNGK